MVFGDEDRQRGLGKDKGGLVNGRGMA